MLEDCDAAVINVGRVCSEHEGEEEFMTHFQEHSTDSLAGIAPTMPEDHIDKMVANLHPSHREEVKAHLLKMSGKQMF